MLDNSFNPDNCVFQNDCIKFNTEDCKDPCWRQREYFWLLDNSNLPKEHKEDIKLIPAPQDLEVFEYLDYIRNNIVEFVSNGNNLVISGYPGSGKTSWSTKLLRRYIMEKSIANGFTERALFINFIWFISEMRHNISEQSKSFKDLRSLCHTIDLLILDDIGATSIKSDYIHDELYSIINDRLDNGLSTIYTTNLNQEQLINNLGSRLAGRIVGKSEIVKIQNRLDLRSLGTEFSFKKFKEERRVTENGSEQ